MEYNIPYPYIGRRKSVQPYELHRGSVVAFKTRDRQPRTGIIIMDDRTMMMAAVNLYKEEGRIWYLEDIPDDIDLFESNKEERLWGYKFFLEEQCGQCKAYEGKDPFVAFIENECPQGDNAWGQTAFCQDFLSYVPKMLDKTEWPRLKQLLWQAIVQSGGLQFNRYSTEYYCYLIGVLMIAEKGISDFTYYPRIETLFYSGQHRITSHSTLTIGKATDRNILRHPQAHALSCIQNTYCRIVIDGKESIRTLVLLQQFWGDSLSIGTIVTDTGNLFVILQAMLQQCIFIPVKTVL